MNQLQTWGRRDLVSGRTEVILFSLPPGFMVTCACGCGKMVIPRPVYFSPTCRVRAWRARKKRDGPAPKKAKETIHWANGEETHFVAGGEKLHGGTPPPPEGLALAYRLSPETLPADGRGIPEPIGVYSYAERALKPGEESFIVSTLATLDVQNTPPMESR